MFRKIIQVVIFSILTVFILSCTEDKFDLNDIDTGSGDVNVSGDTVYVQINPEWGGFNRPEDVMVGREPFIYVADTDNNRIVMLNLDGQVLGIRSIKRPIALAQDYKLNLIVCAQFDTVVNGTNRTFSAVYKLDMVAVQHHIEIAPITKLLPRAQDLNRPLVEYTGACVFFNNMFYIARKGPNNSNFVDPDNSLLIFIPKSFVNSESEGDTLVGRVPNIDPLGQGPVSAYDFSSLTSFNNQSVDIIVTLTGGTSFKANWLKYEITPIDQKYVSNFPPNSTGLVIPNRFERPEGSALDNSGNIYIADAGKDTVYKFNSFGDELQSISVFGDDSLNQPYGVAFFNRTVYVADTGNNRILRFILSTEIQ